MVPPEARYRPKIYGWCEKMKIYIDNDYKCYISPADERMAVETDYFDKMCNAAIEGYRYIPAGSMWTREDGETFMGEAYMPFVDFATLDAAQREYERAQFADMKAALEVLEVNE